MSSREIRPDILDRHYAKDRVFIQQLQQYFAAKSTDELKLIRVEMVREQNMLGNIPLLASTTPIVFLIFGSQLGKYFPHDSLSWMVVAVVSILVIVWSINHHFRVKGRVHLNLYLLDEILKERSQNKSSPVQ